MYLTPICEAACRLSSSANPSPALCRRLLAAGYFFLALHCIWSQQRRGFVYKRHGTTTAWISKLKSHDGTQSASSTLFINFPLLRQINSVIAVGDLTHFRTGHPALRNGASLVALHLPTSGKYTIQTDTSSPSLGGIVRRTRDGARMEMRFQPFNIGFGDISSMFKLTRQLKMTCPSRYSPPEPWITVRDESDDDSSYERCEDES